MKGAGTTRESSKPCEDKKLYCFQFAMSIGLQNKFLHRKEQFVFTDSLITHEVHKELE